MLSKYTNVFFPMCSLFISILVAVLFFSRKKIQNEDTKIYSCLVSCGLIESSLYCLICILAHHIPIESLFFPIANKFLYIIYLIWFTLLFYYAFNVFYEHKKFKVKPVNRILFLVIVDIIFAIFILISPITIFFDPFTKLSNSSGTASTILYFAISLYLISMVIIMIVDIKNPNRKKYIPLSILFALMAGVLILRFIDPLFGVYSNVLSFVVLVMYFTIENPDMKIIKEFAQNRTLVEESIEEKTNLLFEISQEVRMPISRIKELSSNVTNNTTKDLQEKLNVINAESKQLSFFVDKVLDITTINPKTIINYENTYNPKSIFESIEIMSKSKNANFRLTISKSLPKELYGDSVLLKQIFNSIVDFTYNRAPEELIEFKVNNINKYDICRLIISVYDVGEIVDLNTINSILNSTNTESDEDNIDKLILGMNTVNKLIKKLGGYLMINSEEGKGTEIKVILDQKIKVNKSSTDSLNKSVAIYMKKRKIAVVSNNSNILKAFKKLDLGFDISVIMVPNDLFHNIDSGEKYDIIILDDEMQPMSGYSTLMELKKRKKFKTPTLILLQKGKESIKEHYINDGFSDYILISDIDEEIKKIENY